MKKLFPRLAPGPLLLSSCSLVGGNASRPFVWPAAWSDAKPGEAKYGGQLIQEYVPAATSNPFTDQDNAGTRLFLSDGTTGLYRQDPVTMRFVPYVAAESPRISADGRVYTFKLRQNMKFSDGTPITAQDFVNTWKIHADKEVGSIIQGDFFSGDQPVTLRALDALTLEVTFPVPRATAEKILTFAPWPSHIFWKAYQQGGARAVAALWGPQAKASDFVTAGEAAPKRRACGVATSC